MEVETYYYGRQSILIQSARYCIDRWPNDLDCQSQEGAIVMMTSENSRLMPQNSVSSKESGKLKQQDGHDWLHYLCCICSDINFGDDCCKEYKKSLCSASYVHWQRGTTRIRPLHTVLLCTVYSRQSPWGRSRTGLQVLLLLRCRKRGWNNVLRHNTEAAHIYFLL